MLHVINPICLGQTPNRIRGLQAVCPGLLGSGFGRDPHSSIKVAHIVQQPPFLALVALKTALKVRTSHARMQCSTARVRVRALIDSTRRSTRCLVVSTSLATRETRPSRALTHRDNTSARTNRTYGTAQWRAKHLPGQSRHTCLLSLATSYCAFSRRQCV